MDLNDEARIRQIVREEIANSTPHKRKKGNREPTKWQIFLGDCSKQLSKDMPMGERVKACSVQYKKIKESNPKLLDDMVAKAKNQSIQPNQSHQPPTNQPQRIPTNQPQRMNQPNQPPTNQPQRMNQPNQPPTNQPQRMNQK